MDKPLPYKCDKKPNPTIMKPFKFRFYLGKKFWERTYEASTLSQAWKMAHQEASDYPTKRFIEIANI